MKRKYGVTRVVDVKNNMALVHTSDKRVIFRHVDSIPTSLLRKYVEFKQKVRELL